MNKTEIIKLMKEYDFVNNTKKSFAKKYNISSKTVSNYIKEFGIKCKKSGVNVDRNRDIFGKFAYGLSERNDTSSNKNYNSNVKLNKNDGSSSHTNKKSLTFEEKLKYVTTPIS
jgi:hypothetical protein